MEKRKALEKGIILIAAESHDSPVNKVIEWLIFWGEKIVRINEEDDVKLLNFFIENNGEINFEILIRNEIILKFSDIKSFWYRRGSFRINRNNSNQVNDAFDSGVFDFLKRESDSLTKLFNLLMQRKKNINSIFDVSPQKLDNLIKAKSFGLEIPKSLITTSKNELKSFFEDCNHSVISKAISEGISFYTPDNKYNIEGFTSRIDEEQIEKMNDTFFPTLFQEQIHKKWELRVFYLLGTFFTTSIFSQSDPKTEVDFRHYNISKPNRTPPFELPVYIKEKLINFMKANNLNCGSIDLIYSTCGKFYFIEVNPVGQFEQVSFPNNYNIEEQIAKVLKEN